MADWTPWARNNEKNLARYVNSKAATDAVGPGFFSLQTEPFTAIRDLVLGGDRRGALEVMYNNLAARGIRYALEPLRLGDPDNHFQEIRDPFDVVENRRGTCLDLALLFAGLCLEVRLLPLVILLEQRDGRGGHVLVAVDLVRAPEDWRRRRSWSERFGDGLIKGTEARAFVESLLSSGCYVAAESTGFAHTKSLGDGRIAQTMPFSAAVTAAENAFRTMDHVFTIDVPVLLAKGEMPFTPVRERPSGFLLYTSPAGEDLVQLATPQTFKDMVFQYLRAAALADPQPFATSDFALYRGEYDVWMRREMWEWQKYVAHRTRRAALSPPEKRPVLRYVPLLERPMSGPPGLCRLLPAAELPDYWRRIKASLHWMLSAGATVFCTFRVVEKELEDLLIDALTSPGLVLQAPGMYSGQYDTPDFRPGSQQFSMVDDALRAQISAIETRDVGVLNQTRFMLYYTEKNFALGGAAQSYLRSVAFPFLWRLQAGMCPTCGNMSQHDPNEMLLVHVVELERSGNSSLINLEVRCRNHAERGLEPVVIRTGSTLPTLSSLSPADQGFLVQVMSPRLQLRANEFPLSPPG